MVMPKMSASWKASFPSIQDTCCPVITIIGTESMWAVMMPVRVFRSRARSHQHHARLARGAGISVRHVGGALLVPGEDETDARANRLQGVENRKSRPAGISENEFDSEIVQRLDESLSAVHLLFAHKKFAFRR